MEKTESKYECKQCNFKCKYEAQWKVHIETELHKTGKRKKRSDINELLKCEKCGFECRYKTQWNEHIETELHKTGKKKKRSDTKEPLKCEHCDYKTKNETTMKLHKLNVHSTKEERKSGFKYYCGYCDVGTFSKDIIENHENSQKHQKQVSRAEK